jgi:hypothetical protein
MANSTLVAWAFLKVYKDISHSTYLDCFLPLIGQILKSISTPVSNIDIQSQIVNAHGIRVPLHVVNKLMQKARRRNWLSVKGNLYFPNQTELENVSFANVQQKVARMYSALLLDFVKFAGSKYGREISEQQAEDIIFAFLKNNHLFVFQSNLESLQTENPRINEDWRIIFSDYVNTITKSDPINTEYLETIVKGYMISNAIYLPEPQDISNRLFKVKVFFDTTFIMYALGYNGEYTKLTCSELLELLYKNGAQLCCFSHNAEEIRGILTACASRLKSASEGAFGRSVQHFISKGYTETDILALVSQLDVNLERLRIKRVDKPSYDQHIHVISEENFGKLLQDNVFYRRDATRDRDVDSISAIYRLRSGHSSSIIEDSRYIFVTTNTNLALFTKEFYYSDHDSYLVPPCITDFELTNILWLKTPTQVPNLPMQKLIADCYAAIQPSERLMAKWMNEINKHEKELSIGPDDYYFLRYSTEIADSLVETTLNEPDAITEGSVPEIIERARQKAQQQVISESESQIEAEKQKRISAENITAGIQKQDSLRNNGYQVIANRISFRVSKALQWLLSILVLTSCGVSAIFSIISIATKENLIANLIWFLISLVPSILGAVDLVRKGGLVNSLARRLEVWLSKKIFTILVITDAKVKDFGNSQ